MKCVQLSQVGEAGDGRPVVAGVYRWSETHGADLTTIVEFLYKRNWLISWTHYYDEAIAAGMKKDRIISRIREACVDVYGKDHAGVVMEKIEAYAKPDDE